MCARCHGCTGVRECVCVCVYVVCVVYVCVSVYIVCMCVSPITAIEMAHYNGAWISVS